MKKSLTLFFFFLCYFSFSQEDAWVYFNEKPDASMYLSNPLTMLSQRALDRRASQNIALDIKDVPISQSFVDQIENAPGIEIWAKSKWLNAVHVRGSIPDIENLSGMAFVDEIVFADKTLNDNNAGRMSTHNKVSKVSKSFDSQVTYNYGNSDNQVEMLNGHLLHQQNYTGAGKIIAVLDAGFPGVNTAQPFERLFLNNQILGGYNFVSRNQDIYSAGSHGTLVLSTIGGYSENQLVGTAPDAGYYLFVTEDPNSENPVEESLWVEAAETADSLGVDIINTSLGYFLYDNPNYSHSFSEMNGTSTFISRGADIAASRGIVVVVSAGNSGASQYPNIMAPADAINVLTVGAVTASENYAAFSSTGPSFDGRVKPDVMAQGVNSVVSDPFGNIITANGTSFSGPITTGMVACLWQALPNKTSVEIIQLIKASAHLYSIPNPQFGYGIPDYYQALLNGLSIQEFTDNNFSLSPNPVESNITITFPDKFNEADIEIYNALGQIMLHKKLLKNDIISF